MSGILAAQSTVCCCKSVPYAPCDYVEARTWYTQNPTAFPTVQVSAELVEILTRIHVPVSGTSCEECYGKQATIAWNVGGASLDRVPFVPGGGVLPTFARWESRWMDSGTFAQQPGQCNVVLGCCGGCCQPGGNNYDPTCVPNNFSQIWLCEFFGGYCACLMPWNRPQTNTYYYGCGQQNYDVPSPCAACSSRTRETGTRTALPLSVQPQFRIVITIGGGVGLVCSDPIAGCPPPFATGTIWRLEVERRMIVECSSGQGSGDIGFVAATYVRPCCNYLAGPAGTYTYCGTQATPRTGTESSLSECDQQTRTWNYAETAIVT